MSRIKRRQFLQFAGSALATVGLSHLDLLQGGDRYLRALAQPTARKLALLVGIDAYVGDNQLYGCVNDVRLQQELLVHRFGFNSADILTVTDAQATRQGILDAFESHLIDQAKPGDVVVFHFSGHGSRVDDQPECDEVVLGLSNECLNSTLVPVDYGRVSEDGAIRDITGHTLFLLTKALQTENVTVVLDSCHSGGGKRGNIIVRSRQDTRRYRPSNAERDYQQQWLTKLGLSQQEYIAERRAGVANGVVIASARRDQLAADYPFDGFYAGAFTYLLTKYLWQQTNSGTVITTLANVARSTTRLDSDQIPEFEAKPETNYSEQPLYFLEPSTVAADAVITQVTDSQVEFWLGGADDQTLRAYEHATFIALNDNGEKIGEVQQSSRVGLLGKGDFTPVAGVDASVLQVGALLQEQIREIPSNLSLMVGLDPSLGEDIALATQALQAIEWITVTSDSTTHVDCLLGRVATSDLENLNESVETPPAVGSVALFTLSKAFIQGTEGGVGESVDGAIARLTPKLKSLLAANLLRMTVNTGSSRLGVAVEMIPTATRGGEGAIRSLTSRGQHRSRSRNATSWTPTTVAEGMGELQIGTQVRFSVTNSESVPLYVSVLQIVPTGQMDVVYPAEWTSPEDDALVAAGQAIDIPESGFQITVGRPLGVTEVLVIASTNPLRNTLRRLQSIASLTGRTRGAISLRSAEEEPTDVINDLLQDLNEGVRGSRSLYVSATDRGVSTEQVAAISLSYRAVEA